MPSDIFKGITFHLLQSTGMHQKRCEMLQAYIERRGGVLAGEPGGEVTRMLCDEGVTKDRAAPSLDKCASDALALTVQW
eukprot:CAMPEP_0114171152 /NCGR_PEP_ID=MMETSP0043_2-20121206/34539_1 /TAXON_ID=464988 /ORGANISM="Hemiselmis andersenii, Strain CCMP644" /LENGTH=78 /DNA_ID=CAMNT_0001268841 /DNA_START=53 /DNA_END=286 /DNA_ORIENTATION=-